MNYKELNSFIKRYATQDKTKTAMMLTGEWGSGKSYYINKALCPYLKKHKVQCVVVSLYGVDSLSELSKRIYLRLRVPTLSKKSEVKEVASIIGHSIIDNALSLKGLNVGVSEDQLVKLYESVNLKGVLIIFEDLERSSIDILMLLGYINGLVEYDGAKVLLVANEKEILGQNTEPLGYDLAKIFTNQAEEKEELPEDDRQIHYLRMKEKTIGDTVLFTPDIKESVRSILNEYTSNWITAISQDDEIEKLVGILGSHCNNNLRVFIYALQKCDDIFSSLNIDNRFEDAFYQVALEGALIISKSFLGSDIPRWEGTNCISVQLGEPRSPLFRFIYDYLKTNTFDEDDIIATSNEYVDYCCFEKNATRDVDPDLYILDNIYVQTEVEVRNALENVQKKLKKTSYLSIRAYEQLALKVILAGIIIGYDTETICSQMISNTKKMCRTHPSSSQEIIWGLQTKVSYKPEVMNKYKSFMKCFAEAIDDSNKIDSFSYKPNALEAFYSYVRTNKHIFLTQQYFISSLDNRRLITMLLSCSSNEISCFRSILLSFYNDAIQGAYDDSDKKALSDLLEKLEKITPGKAQWDKIQWLQIDYLKQNIEEFIRKLW